MILSNRKDLINNEPKFKQLIAEHLDKWFIKYNQTFLNEIYIKMKIIISSSS
jgi:hypothetical protein